MNKIITSVDSTQTATNVFVESENDIKKIDPQDLINIGATKTFQNPTSWVSDYSLASGGYIELGNLVIVNMKITAIGGMAAATRPVCSLPAPAIDSVLRGDVFNPIFGTTIQTYLGTNGRLNIKNVAALSGTVTLMISGIYKKA